VENDLKIEVNESIVSEHDAWIQAKIIEMNGVKIIHGANLAAIQLSLKTFHPR
jgi:acetyltransferase-like isoleucine patch superfamily enzyme